MNNLNSILPIGKITLKTGRSKYFNIYDTWGEDTTYEIYECGKNSNPEEMEFRIVATSGTTSICKIGDTKSFKHDQTGRYLFQGKMVDSAVGSELKNLISKYGSKIKGYTYK